MLIVDLALSVVAVLATIAAFLMLAYLASSERQAPRFSSSILALSEKMEKTPLISIIVTAKNEEQTIARCLNSLLAQTYPSFEVVVVDDSSKDSTPKIAKQFEAKDGRVRLFEAGPKPKDWVGKSWPCWQGFEFSKGELLLFVDADSVFQPNTVELVTKYFLSKGHDIFSIAPEVRLKSIWARAVSPLIAGAINLLYPMKKVNDPSNKRAYVFGTFILVRRTVYESIGGHRDVRSQIVEDAALAQRAKALGYKLRVERGSEFASTEWESDIRSVYSGVERVTSTSIRSYGLVSILNAVLLFFVAIYPLLFVIGAALLYLSGPTNLAYSQILLVGLAASVLDIIFFLSITWIELRMISEGAGLSAILYPLGVLIFAAAIVTTSIKVSTGKRIEWKGEMYVQEVERSGG